MVCAVMCPIQEIIIWPQAMKDILLYCHLEALFNFAPLTIWSTDHFGIGFCLWGRCSVWDTISVVWEQAFVLRLWNHRCVVCFSHSVSFMGSICLFKQFSTKGRFAPPGTSCSFWRHFVVTCVYVCVYYWHQADRLSTSLTLDSSIMKNHPWQCQQCTRWWDPEAIHVVSLCLDCLLLVLQLPVSWILLNAMTLLCFSPITSF